MDATLHWNVEILNNIIVDVSWKKYKQIVILQFVSRKNGNSFLQSILRKKMIFCYYPFQEKVTRNCDTLVHLKKKCEKTYCFSVCLQIQIPINKDDAILVKLEWQRSTTRAKIKYHVEGHFIHMQKEWLSHNNISSCHFQFLTFWDHKQSKEETHR
jgi:hypothetical protein